MADNIALVPAEPDHIEAIAERMRQADIDEVLASSGRSPADALEYSLAKSAIAMTALVDDRPEVMFGVGDLNILTQTGAPWLLGTEAVTEHWVVFLRASLSWRNQLLARYQVLTNVVDDRNTVSKRWLRWLGFRLSDPFPIGRGGAMFRLFELRRGDV